MSWLKIYKLAQMDMVQQDLIPYNRIGHDVYFNKKREKPCKEWIWLWDGYDLLVEEADKNKDHRNTYSTELNNISFKGRASECVNKISINCPYRGNIKMDVPEDLEVALENRFPGMTAYIY